MRALEVQDINSSLRILFDFYEKVPVFSGYSAKFKDFLNSFSLGLLLHLIFDACLDVYQLFLDSEAFNLNPDPVSWVHIIIFQARLEYATALTGIIL